MPRNIQPPSRIDPEERRSAPSSHELQILAVGDFVLRDRECGTSTVCASNSLSQPNARRRGSPSSARTCRNRDQFRRSLSRATAGAIRQSAWCGAIFSSYAN